MRGTTIMPRAVQDMTLPPSNLRGACAAIPLRSPRAFGGAACLASLTLFATVTPATAQTGAQPALVTAYLKQLATVCGPGASPGSVSADRVDLNRDGLDDWVVDAGRQPCAKRSSAAARDGDLVTVFVTLKDGRTVPAFQRNAHGVRLQRVSGVTSLWLTVSGDGCASADPAIRCDRPLEWRPEAFRFDLGASAPGALTAKR